MDLLPVNFYVLRFCGAWKERKESNLIIRFFSFCYRYTIAALIYYFTVSEIIELVRTRNDVEDLTEGLFLALTYVALCMKYLNFLTRQREMRALLDRFRFELCQPRNSAEESILRQYDRKAKRTACFFMLISQTTGLLILIMPLLAPDKRRLPCKVYVPYSIAALLPYVLTYLQQAAALFYGVLLNVSFDSLVYGLIIHACGQIELLCHRLTVAFRSLQESNGEEKRIGAVESLAVAECVRHHISVYDIVHRVQSLFVWTIALLFFFSLVTLCTSIYQMSRKEPLSPEFFTFTLYLGSMLFQAFSYCWYGNELDLKNKSIAHAIYVGNWLAVSTKQRKSLSFVMMMSQRGRIVSFYGVFALILDTFTWILKTSYSAFNLLQQTSN